MIKRIASVLLICVMLAGLVPALGTEARAETVMSAWEFVERLISCARDYKTLYVMGGFGAPMTPGNKVRYINGYSYNGEPERAAMINAADSETFGFDCVCLIKGILWGWCGDASRPYGGAVYASNGVPDVGTETIIGLCSEVSKEFDTDSMLPGELLWMPGHVGIYIGDGLAVECSPAWENKVQITACNQTIAGYNRRNWTKHGLLPYVDYTNENCEHKWNGVGVCERCRFAYDFEATLDQSVCGTYTVIKPGGFLPRVDGPYDAAARESYILSPGERGTLVGAVTNAFGNVWYKILYENETKTGYAYSTWIDTEHVHSFDELVMCDEGAHPHYGFYKCLCGETRYRTDRENFVETCPKCLDSVRPEKPELFGLNRQYTELDDIAFNWRPSENGAVYYSLYIDRLNDGEFEPYDSSPEAARGETKRLPPGSYRAQIVAYDPDHSEADGSGALQSASDYAYFQVFSSQTAHNYQLSSNVAAECEKDGALVYVCADCGETFTVTVPAIGHYLAHIAAVEATPVADGNIDHFRCMLCGKCFADGGAATGLDPADVAVKYTAPTGDVNEDGKLNSRDVIALMKLILTPDPELTAASDVNSDGKLNSRDVIELMKLVIAQS